MSIKFSKRMAGKAAGMTAALAGLFVVMPGKLPAAMTTDDARIAFIEADDGLTRESIPVLSRPDASPHAATPKAAPTPAPKAAPASTPAPAATPTPHYHSTRRTQHPQIVIRSRRHRWRHHHREIAQAEETPSSAPAQPPAHRNWVVRFVVWWNGFADRRLNGIGHVPLHDDA